MAKWEVDTKLRKLLQGFGVGTNVVADRMIGTTAYGDAALMVSSPDGKSKHMVWATKKAGLDDAARGLLKREGIENPTAEQIDNQLQAIRAAGGERYSTDEALLAQAQAQQKVASQAYFQRLEAVEAFLARAKTDPEFRAAVGPEMGFPATAAPPGKPPGADDVAAKAANPEGIKPEANDWWTASQPELKDIPVLGGLPRWGLAALGAGTTAASAGLAYHLMAQGQQQSDPVAYAAAAQAIQAMNAY